MLYSAFFVIGAFAAPLAAGFGEYELSAKLTTIFMFSCHQQPDRSFWLLGYPFALCCRCFGFYSGCVCAALSDLLNRLNIPLKVLLLLVVFPVIDIILNFLLHINTGNIVRYINGFLMGIDFILLVKFLLESNWRCIKK